MSDFFLFLKGELKVWIDKVFPLSHAPEAHYDLEARKTKGRVLLNP